MSRFTYGISAALTLAGIGSAITGIVLGEFKPTFAGLVLIFGAFVFARLYVGMRRKQSSLPNQAIPSSDR
jgi:hypothetical protein